MAALELHFIEGPVSKADIEKAIQGLESLPQRVSGRIKVTISVHFSFVLLYIGIKFVICV